MRTTVVWTPRASSRRSMALREARRSACPSSGSSPRTGRGYHTSRVLPSSVTVARPRPHALRVVMGTPYGPWWLTVAGGRARITAWRARRSTLCGTARCTTQAASSTAVCPGTTCPPWGTRWPSRSPTSCPPPGTTSPGSSPHPWSGPGRPVRPPPRPSAWRRRRILASSRPATPSRAWPSTATAGSWPTPPTGPATSTRCAPPGASPTGRSSSACAAPSSPRSTLPRATRRSSSPTSCLSGRCASSWRAAPWPTTRAAASAPWPP